ncbi:DUF4169 domain-containing protein [Acuticoccus sediminis]|uniref:DUF4169 domain-containing protein n=1 Tax=Acuticoccus sediminis TaxID=2184697 RepID=A0A8B2NFE1_9HYPH|nr:DUF4169 family protein [Acuticoccus sediminis]RAH97718.1 DUF4169 domain-containing protein [Acuticoccus sediminis]
MTGELVNLRRERKRRQRDADREAAAESRARHGRTAAQRNSETLSKEREDARHEAHKRDRTS